MGLIPEDVIREIRERSDIVAVIGQHVNLRKAGHNHKGLCPFHGEKTPSFNVNGEKGFFYCFGCQKKGDIFSFLMEYEGKSFTEAAESLAAQLGIEIARVEEPEAVRRQRGERTRMLEINRIATDFYSELLAAPAGAPGRAYLEERGIGNDVSELFQLGYAPDQWRALGDYLASKNVSMKLAIDVGLAAPQPRAGGSYDRFRNRLMCPVIVPGGEVSGFSGRVIPADTLNKSSNEKSEAAKYINSPESPVYKKSKLLFGLAQARESIRAKGRIVLVEGNFDVISLHQAGFSETVAPLGTALTDDQTGLMRRFSERAVLLYDADKAGHAAALKALVALTAAEVEVYIATLPTGEDPDSMVKNRGAEALEALLDRAQLGIEYFAHEVFARTVRSAAGRTRTLRAAADIARSVRNPIKRNLIVDQLALGMDIDHQLVWQAVGGRGSGRRPDERSGGANWTSRTRNDRTGAQSNPATDRFRAASSAQNPAREDSDGGGPRGAQHGANMPREAANLPHPLGISPDNPSHMPSQLELDLLSLVSDHPDLVEVAEENDVFSLLTDARLRDMYCAARQGRPIMEALPEDAHPAIATHLMSGAFATVNDPRHALVEAVTNLKKVRKRAKLVELQQRAEVAKRRGDAELERELVHEILTTRRQVD